MNRNNSLSIVLGLITVHVCFVLGLQANHGSSAGLGYCLPLSGSLDR